jgi:N-acetyl-D-muramate 6-phosphate phosphatase
MPDGVARPVPHPLDVVVVLFDLDGTLADSAPDLANALNLVRRGRGLPPVSVDTLRPHASSGARGLLRAGMGITPEHPEYVKLRDEFLDHYAAGLAQATRLFSGVAELLTALESHALRWGIVTNKALRFTAPVVAALGLSMRADVVVAGDSTPHPKPHPAPLLHAAEILGVAPSACVYVGDDLRDVLAGNAAGMPTLVAEYGYLGESGNSIGWPATGWIDSPGDLLAWMPVFRNQGSEVRDRLP